MSIYRLDLDALEESEKEHEQSATKVNENIEDIYSVINEVNEDIYSGDDGDTFRSKLADFVVKEVTPLQEKLTQIKTVLADGLSDAKSCKKLCNDFVITLGGAGNGKSAEDMQGELYCDQSVIDELKGFCRSALSYSDSIRTICTSINDILWELVMVKLYPTPYTSAIKEGCDKVDRLEDHSRELDAYATAAETIDSSFQGALDGCVPDFFLGMEIGLGVGEQNVQTEIIMGIMGQQGTLSETDKAILDEQLKILEEKGDIEELKQVAEHAGNGENEAWTAGDAYVMAYIYNYAENNVNAELATAVYDKMKKVTYVQTTNSVQPPSTIFTYEFRLDENKVEAISAELDPEKDGLAYYSLQRRSKYCETKIIVESGMNVKVPEMELTIQFTQDENGKLVSVFTVDREVTRLASVDMNEIVGEEGKKNLDKLGYSKEERIAFMSSIYTDEEISLIGGLARAEEEEGYRDVFQNDPDQLSTDVKARFYNYSVKLMDSCVKYDENMMVTSQNFTQFENFINGMLYKKSYIHESQEDNRYTWINDYRDDYLELLITYGELQMDLLRYPMKENYENKEYILDNLAVFAENTQVLSLYATLDHRLHDWHKTGNGLYVKVSGLNLETDNYTEIQDSNINNVMFSYHETIMEDEKPCTSWPLYEEGLVESDIQIVKLTGSSIAEKEDELTYAEKARAAKWAIPKAVIDNGMVALSAINNTVGTIMTVKDVISNGATALESFSELDKAEKIIYCRVGGAYIGYKDDGSSMTILLEGQYDANAMLKMSRLENEGYAKMAGLEDGHADEVAESLMPKVNGYNISAEQILSYEKYLLWVGKTGENKCGESCDIQTFSNIPLNVLSEGLREFDGNSSDGIERFRYGDYNMINEYYLGDKGK